MSNQNQGRRSGGGQAPRQVQRTPEQPSQNQRITIRERASQILAAVRGRQAEITAFLPSNVSFDRFLAVLSTALRHNPEILECTTASIVQACCKAAYDNLMPDGRECAFVVQNVKVGKEPNHRWEKHIRYNPMVYGLILQMVRSGAVTDVHATLVYEGEPYKVLRGTTNLIEHEELPNLRGPGKPIVGVYAVAWLPGGHVKFETMSLADVVAVRAIAATDYVWNKNEGEMTRKTVIRRLRKSIAGTAELPDAEAMTMFPQFAGAQAAQSGLPAPAAPDRRNYQSQSQLAAPEQTLDPFAEFDRHSEEMFAEQGGTVEPERQQNRSTPKAKKTPEKQPPAATVDEGKAKGPETSPPAEEAEPEQGVTKAMANVTPTTPEGWAEWSDIICGGLEKFDNMDAVNEQWDAQRELLEKAPKQIRELVNDAFHERLTDIATGDTQGTLNITDGDRN